MVQFALPVEPGTVWSEGSWGRAAFESVVEGAPKWSLSGTMRVLLLSLPVHRGQTAKQALVRHHSNSASRGCDS
jgi:hypothetical protein